LNGIVDGPDLTIFLGAWGETSPSPIDLNGDGIVGPEDLTIFLGNWGTTVEGGGGE
jgi:hypothetical protein